MKDGTKTDINIGLSGCILKLVGNNVIRKSSPTKQFNQRLEHQINKQVSFSNTIYTNIYTPKIYNSTPGCFDMEYIPGENYMDFFSKASKEDLDLTYINLTNYFDTIQSNKKYYNSKVVKSKLNNKLNSLSSNSQYKNFINYIIDKVNTLEFNNIPKTFCHGDLSLTNIIFYKKRLYFIDFLDSYIDTFIVDLVKIQQDLQYKWALNIHNGNLRTDQSFNYLWGKIYTKYQEYYSLEFTKIVNILNWLRIEPYLTQPKHKEVLNHIITNLEYYEEFNNTNSRKI